MNLVKNTDMQKDIKANAHSNTVGFPGTPLGEVFTHYIDTYGSNGIYFICSLVYNLGKMHGKREERARKMTQEQTVKTNNAPEESELDRVRRNIIDMVSRIGSEDRLRRIFFFTHTNFINDRQVH